jgi:hypothetical protein
VKRFDLLLAAGVSIKKLAQRRICPLESSTQRLGEEANLNRHLLGILPNMG